MSQEALRSFLDDVVVARKPTVEKALWPNKYIVDFGSVQLKVRIENDGYPSNFIELYCVVVQGRKMKLKDFTIWGQSRKYICGKIEEIHSKKDKQERQAALILEMIKPLLSDQK